LAVVDEAKARFFERYSNLTREQFAAAGKQVDPTAEIQFLASFEVGALRRMIDELAVAGHTDAAIRITEYLLALYPQDHEVRIRRAAVTAQSGKPSQGLWDSFFKESDDFGMQLAGLREIARLEAANHVPGAWFERYATQLAAGQRGNQQNQYMLSSLRVHRFKMQKQWQKALAAVAAMRPNLRPAQRPGVDYEEADIRWQLGNAEVALPLLEKNLRALPSDSPVFADSARLLAVIYASRAMYFEAAKYINIAARSIGDPNSLVRDAARIAAQMREAGEIPRARAMLVDLQDSVDGNARGLLLIEQGKHEMAAGNRAAAKRFFEETGDYLTDATALAWLRETLADWDQQ